MENTRNGETEPTVYIDMLRDLAEHHPEAFLDDGNDDEGEEDNDEDSEEDDFDNEDEDDMGHADEIVASDDISRDSDSDEEAEGIES